MSASLAVEVLLALLTTAVAAAAYFSAQKANQAQAKASTVAVDAAAYERAKVIYEGAIEALQAQTADLQDQVVQLSGEVERLRSANTGLGRKISVLERRLRGTA